jgi:dinuclear metal center YbgI/SA1388 family protein
MEKLSSLVNHFNSLWPESEVADWDWSGLMIGELSSDIHTVVLSVDVTIDVLAHAKKLGANLILSHHPMFLKGAHTLREDSAKGSEAAFAIKNDLAVFSAHTNADFVPNGVSQTLAKALGLGSLDFLDAETKQGVIGTLGKPTTLLDFARAAAKVLPSVAQGLRVAGDPNRKISKVGLVAGAGDSYLNLAQAANLDLFITSDLRHHPSQDFVEQAKLTNGPALMDIAHWAAEWLWLEAAQQQLSDKFESVSFIVSDLSTDPWNFVVMQ